MLRLGNTHDSWGLVAIMLHWITATTVFGLYALGWYMVDLDYYDSWYRTAPYWHKSVGLLLCLIVIIRLVYKVRSTLPGPIQTHKAWERIGAKVAHLLLYILLFVCFVSGYLISTADGRGIEFFGLFELPAMVSDIDNLEDIAGDIHIMATDAIVVLAIMHAGAAIKHHFIDRDATLKRMMGKVS